MSSVSHKIPLSLYIHVPWCVRKCPYCDFNSHALREEVPERAYIDALLADLEHDLEFVHGREIQSIFIGGGTPSLLSAEAYERLFAGLADKLQFADDIEITLEANPGTVDQGRFADYHAVGINRLSIGVQSFANDMLESIGRIHDRQAAIRAAEAAHAVGYDNFNLDLMFGLPQQTATQAMEDLHTAIALEPAHISWYQLTLEPNTLFYQRPPVLPDDDKLWGIQQQGQDVLQANGYQQYEVSAYSRNRQCRHNLNYWQFGDYLGIGAGAHAKLSDPALVQIQRRQRVRHPQDYISQASHTNVISGQRELDTQDRILEFMMNALRLSDGVTVDLFKQCTGLDLEEIASPFQQAVEKGLLLNDGQRLQASASGQQYLNSLLELFMLEPA